MRLPTARPLPSIFLAVVLATFLLALCRPIGDSDLYWHLASGRWISEHGELPSADPFAHTSVAATSPAQTDRNTVILRSYWLGQRMLLTAWDLGGSAGIVALRTLVHFAILCFLFVWMRRRTSSLVALFLTFLAGVLLVEYPNERPQLFSFLFAPLLLCLLEQASFPTGRLCTAARVLLVPFMLVWSHIHGAFLLGDVLILIYLTAHLAESAIRRTRPELPLVASLVGAVAITSLNPSGLSIVRAFLTTDPEYLQGVTEYLSPFAAASNLQFYFPSYWTFLFICVVTLIVRIRTVRIAHLGVLVALALLSVSALRHMYYLLAAAPLLAPYLPTLRWSSRRFAVAGLLLGAFIYAADWDHLSNSEVKHRFPREAADFVKQSQPSGKLFNHYDWGGYLILNLPDYPVFVDSRGLFAEIVAEHGQVMWTRQWSSVLDRHGINLMVVPGVSIGTGKVYPLVTAAAVDPQWQLVHQDEMAVVFVRTIPDHQQIVQRHALPISALQRHIADRAAWILREFPKREHAWISKADAEFSLGRTTEARASYRAALEVNQANAHARRMLAHLADGP